jgi:GT2 family glycosyltransferase
MAGLEAQTIPATDMEVIVVDDGSSDGTAEYLASLTTTFQLIVLRQSNAGPAAARNRAVQHARGEIVLFVDDDVIPAPALVEAHLAAHASAPDAVVIGPMLAPRGLPRPAWVRWEEDRLAEQYRDMEAGRYPCSPRQFYTANASLPRMRLIECGGFDPTFKRAEDVELAYRLRDRGSSFVFAPSAQVVHVPTRAFDSWCATPYLYGRYDVAMFRDKGHESFACAATEFHWRNPLIQALARVCVDRPGLSRWTERVLRVAVRVFDRKPTRRLSEMGLSGIFSIRYWQGAADELGGARPLWTTVERARPAHQTRAAANAA